MNPRTRPTAHAGGSELARFPRGPREDPEREVLRLSLDTYDGGDGRGPARYVSLRIWYRVEGGEYRPSKRGITLRKGELYQGIKALCSAARTLGVDLHPDRAAAQRAEHGQASTRGSAS